MQVIELSTTSTFDLMSIKCPLFWFVNMASTQNFKLLPSELVSNILPTIKEVIQAILFEKNKNEYQKNSSGALVAVSNQVIRLWNRASIPTVHIKTVRDKINKFHAEYVRLSHANQKSSVFPMKLRNFKVKWCYKIKLGISYY